jgi:hypothetical protein
VVPLNYPIDDVRGELENNDLVLLDQFLDDAEYVCDQLQYLELSKEYSPLQHSWRSYKGKKLNSLLIPVLVFLKEVTGNDFVPELLVLEDDDYSILNDETPAETGTVAFLDLSLGWEMDWGGYLALGNQPVPLNANNLLIANMKDQRWFIKKINHYAQLKKILVVFRSA